MICISHVISGEVIGIELAGDEEEAAYCLIAFSKNLNDNKYNDLLDHLTDSLNGNIEKQALKKLGEFLISVANQES